MNEHVWWYVARSSGIVAWGVLATSVLLGLILSTRAFGRRPPAAWTADLHRGVSGVAVLLVTVHLAALIADTTVVFDAADVLVPFASSWRPAAVAWGVVALYLLVAVEVTSLLRRRLSVRAWRAVHASSIPLYAAATAHLVTAGTDATSTWLLVLVWVSMVATAVLTLVRLLAPRGRVHGRPGPAPSSRRPDRSQPSAQPPGPPATAPRAGAVAAGRHAGGGGRR